MLRIITSLAVTFVLTSSAQAYHYFHFGTLFIEGTNDDDVIVVEIIRPRLDNLETTGTLGDFSDRTVYDPTGSYDRPNKPIQLRFTITNVRGDIIETADYDYADAEQILINGGDGNDFLFNETDLPSHMSGGRGSDVLSGGSGPDYLNGDSPIDDQHWDDPDILFGNAGNDELIGGGRGKGFLGLVRTPAPDELYGGPGEDLLRGQVGTGLFVGNGDLPNDLLDGEGGKDTYHYFDWDFLAEFDSFGKDVTPDEPQTFLQYKIVYE